MTLILCAPGSGAAQNVPVFEVAGGYSFAHPSTQVVDGEFHGWIASVTGNLSPIFGITGQLGGSYRSMDLFGNGDDAVVALHSFLAGPRFAVRPAPNITVFGQFLAGAHRFGVAGVSATDFAVQPGVGVDFWVSPNVAIRAGADYRRAFRSQSRRPLIFEGNRWSQFVVHVGGVVAGGER